MVDEDNGTAREARVAALRALVRLETDPRAAIMALASYDWDYGEDLVIVTPIDLMRILNKYLKAELTDDEWKLWAEALEGRDDLGFEEESEELVKEFIFQSATPEIFEPLTPLLARRWLSRLDRESR